MLVICVIPNKNKSSHHPNRFFGRAPPVYLGDEEADWTTLFFFAGSSFGLETCPLLVFDASSSILAAGRLPPPSSTLPFGSATLPLAHATAGKTRASTSTPAAASA